MTIETQIDDDKNDFEEIEDDDSTIGVDGKDGESDDSEHVIDFVKFKETIWSYPYNHIYEIEDKQ